MPKKSDKSTEDSKDVLDLIDDTKKKPSRRQRQKLEAEATTAPSKVEAAKANALDLFAEDEKPKVKKKNATAKKVLGSISKILEKDDEDLSLVGGQDIAPVAAAAPVAASDDSDGDESDDPKLIVIKPPILVPDLAARLGLKPFEVMADLIKLGVFPAPNQPLEPDIAAQVCEIHGFHFEREKRDKEKGFHKEEKVIEEPELPEEEPEDELKTRPPIVTIMGHVDHGKTSILDFYRKSKVVSGEAGGITQHIGAYQVTHSNQVITFLDTPGHAIFSDMRERGAAVTDIAIIVVAANDGLMPQTKEAIKHAQKAKKTIIIAINKCDLPAANVDRVKSQLAEIGLQTVDYGGDTEFACISALKGDGMDDLLELIVLQAEVLELKANPKATTRAGVIEARVVPGRGTTATVIVEAGTLKVGTPFICGPFSGKVRSLINDLGQPVKCALPGMPVEVIGFEELPNVGDHLTEMKTEREAKSLATERQDELRLKRLKPQHKNRMEDLFSRVNDGGEKNQLKIILKCDVQGSVEAIKKAIEAIESDKVETQFITAAAGPITESDIAYAASSEAVVIGFNVKVDAKAVKSSKAAGVEIKLYSIVYELIDQVREAMLGLLDPLTRESIMGHAECRQVFKVNKGKAAGCFITDGKVHRKAHARVIRGGVPVFDGKMSTLRRFHEEVEEVRTNFECGIRLGEFNDYEEGDIIECYKLEKYAQEL
ncbi:MAG: translation initiation factor IF-2 [Akkermansiaceae bacterium]|nr:translation initiation factor IF-2 [Akkermansiaceae bacterium]MDP4647420.1 translation initiation factor IF-2 [Akkermansiaceae bacterium]MDP4721239.1 translation initiation factor IF-2 [Akkermansiaceae bacterium]MDP4781565.1 translation initiation factor IF-2 [Akkermansiaceae bacterium]MDP4848026.1 translation initiation factor IF-2 [Akkermansiaceae bacterium]